MINKAHIFIQARLTSTRFPSKVIQDIDGLPSIVFQYQRVKRSNLASEVVVIIPDDKENNTLAETLEDYSIPYFRGHPEILIRRFEDAARFYKSEIIVRTNGDCPLISSSSIDATISTFTSETKVDYCSTTLDTSFPVGEHCEAFSYSALLKGFDLFEISKEIAEHVTPLFYRNPEFFNCLSVPCAHVFPEKLRLCVDYPEDLHFIRSLLLQLPNKGDSDLIEIINTVRDSPNLLDINSHYQKDRALLS
ncbi:8-amino-3,8-dideoxy-manno-octulosonate cytidylyltransferase [Synechococcus sp. CBW1107]|nr:8-amino-3,8-dideoxy-manno-octulosonate cytidylyltransferase [Synechococcus sp. CBW1107]